MLLKKMKFSAVVFLLTAVASPFSQSAAQPYTTEELIELIPKYIANGHSSGLAFDNDKSKEFNENLSADCEIFYPLITRSTGPSLGYQIFDGAIRYISSKDSGKQEYSERLKSDLSELRKKSSKICSDGLGPEYFNRLQALIDSIIKAGPTIKVASQGQIQLTKEGREKLHAAERQRNADYANKDAKDATCKATPLYQVYLSSYIIERNRPFFRNAQQEITRQQDGAKISGYIDKNRMYELGNTVSRINRENADAFAIYRKNGGTQSHADLVKILPNPCQ